MNSNFHDGQVRRTIADLGPAAAFRKLIAASDRELAGPELDIGLEASRRRTAIYNGLMAPWAATQRERFAYDRPFAVVALGGTGRGEMTPCSDTDYAFLFDDAIEGNDFLMELQRQVLHTSEFEETQGFEAGALPFNLEDMPELDTIQRNSFLDMTPVYDPDDLAPRFRERIRATFDPFEHFLHASSFWRDHWGETKGQPERLDEFDIKKDGLRVFLAGIWCFAGRGFIHSHEAYARLEDPRDLEAYGFLLRVRSWVHLRRGTRTAPVGMGNHVEDVLHFDDFRSFGAMLGPDADEEERFAFDNEVRSRLLSARRRVDRFTRGMVGRALKEGREIRPGSAIIHGTGGLRDTAAPTRGSKVARSRAALAMLLAAQRYALPIDPSELETTFHEAGDWLVPVPELSGLFYETRGSLADSFEFLAQLDGAEDRLFPGYRKFEVFLDERILAEQRTLRGTHEREKLRALEASYREGVRILEEAREPRELEDAAHEVSVPVETALLEPNSLAAVKLALKTKRLPETPDDERRRADASLPIHERLSSGLSGIPLEEYYATCFRGAGFAEETLDTARFLVRNRSAFRAAADAELIGAELVEEFVELCGGEERLRALFVFTCADRAAWQSEESAPSLWFNIRELFCKARMMFHPRTDPVAPLVQAGYGPEDLVILEDFGSEFFESVYRHYAIRFGVHLLRLADGSPEARPRVSLIRRGTSVILGVAARDDPGMAACITGALWARGIHLSQAHLFSAAHHGLALNFFHLGPDAGPVEGAVLKELEDEIRQCNLARGPGGTPAPEVAEDMSLRRWRRDLYCLRAQTTGDAGALIYELARVVYRVLGANIFGLAAHTGRESAFVSVYHNLPGMSEEEARKIIGAPD